MFGGSAAQMGRAEYSRRTTPRHKVPRGLYVPRTSIGTLATEARLERGFQTQPRGIESYKERIDVRIVLVLERPPLADPLAVTGNVAGVKNIEQVYDINISLDILCEPWVENICFI